jgi:pimeloyl-ACP methyl ester carboxylesterase
MDDLIRPATTRISMRFSVDGSMAACLAADRGQPYQVEVWRFGAAAERSRPLRTPDGETLFTQSLPLTGGSALLLRRRHRAHDLVRLRSDGSGTREDQLATVIPGFRLLAGAGHRALAVSWDGERSTVWHVDPATGCLERLAEAGGMLTGGAALDPSGRELGFTLTGHDMTRTGVDGAAAVGLDLHTGDLRPLAASASHLLMADPASGLAVLAIQTCDGMRLAYRRPRDPGAAAIVPERLNGLDGTVLPLAVSPGGDAMALRVRRGARTHLYLHRPADDRLTEVDTPAGIIGETGAWSSTGLRFPYGSPVCPSGIARVAPGTLSWRLAGVASRPGGGEWHQAHLERFPGPAGLIEAVVYGDWRTAEHVVVALHGGPEAAWEADFHLPSQHMAAAGLAVVAPNQRGSTGYGTAHAAAIHHAWGGPDRRDINHLGLVLRRQRPAGATAPALYGESYGAYLALLAAAHEPELWSRCAAVAPFLSGARLYDEATAEVRALIDRLGGRSPLPGCAGDLAVVASRIAVPLLIVHGADDETVPATQSRRLREHLLAAGRREGRDLHYVEVPGAGHDPLSSPRAPTMTGRLVGFLTGADP